MRTVARNDPQYFDLRFWPTPDPDQHWVDARREQIAAIEARKVELRQKRETLPISDKSPQRGRALAYRDQAEVENAIASVSGLRQVFPALLPAKPYCADDLEEGLRIRSRPLALKRRHIQFNGPNAYRWLLHDIDRGDAVLAHDDACLPPPNVIMINPANGHAHCAYLLENAVARHSASRAAPLRYFAAVERGFARRLGADRRFAGLIAKNPLHEHWRVEWRRDRPYTLGELEDWLWPRDTEPDHYISEARGAGRNCTIFEELRQVAYREVLEFKRGAGDLGAFRVRLERVALGINLQFPEALQLSEVRAIARSVAKWTWARFSLEGFFARQARLSKIANDKRWAGHVAESRTMPWQIQKVSRATYYRQKAAARVPSPSTPSQPAVPPWTMSGISRATYYRRKKAGEL